MAKSAEKERVQYKFMIPEDLKAKLEESAYMNRRSLSAEIIDRLEYSYMQQDIDSRLAAIELIIEKRGLNTED